MAQLWVDSYIPRFSRVTVNGSTNVIFQAGVGFPYIRLRETLRHLIDFLKLLFLIDLLRIIYFLLKACAFPAFRKWYWNCIFFFLMLTSHNSVSSGMLTLKLTLLTTYNFETFRSKRFSIKRYESTNLQKPIYGPFQSPTVGAKSQLTSGNQHWISRLSIV